MSSQSKDNTCPTCGGQGEYEYFRGRRETAMQCPDCNGSGQQEDNTGHPTAETPNAQPLENVSGEQSGNPEWIGANSVFVYSFGYSMIAKAIAPLMEYTNFTKNAKGEYDQQAYLDVINNIEALLREAESGDDEPDEALPSSDASESVRVDAPLTDSKPEKPLTLLDVENNKSVGWFVEDGLVKQVVTISPYKVRVVGELEPEKPVGILDLPEDERQALFEKAAKGSAEKQNEMLAKAKAEPDQLGIMLANLYLAGKWQNNEVHGFNKEALREARQTIQALLATEYDRGRIDEAKTCEQAKRHDSKAIAKAEYDRGKVDGGIEELEKLQVGIIDSNHQEYQYDRDGGGRFLTIYDGKCFECAVQDRLDELKCKGEAP